MGMVRRKMGEDIYLTSLKENAYKKEIATLKEEIKNLKADVKYERELRVNGTAYHPTDYHSRLREMISKVRKEKKLNDLFDIVDEAQKRLRDAN
jgi:sugar-specific transcriptional regulator TrmB